MDWISTLLSSLAGGLIVALVNAFLQRKRTHEETRKLKIENDKTMYDALIEFKKEFPELWETLKRTHHDYIGLVSSGNAEHPVVRLARKEYGFSVSWHPADVELARDVASKMPKKLI